MKTKPTVETPPTTPRLPIGTRVRIKRPNMWAGESGVVESYTGDLHIIRIDTELGGWAAGAKYDECEVIE